MPDDEKLFENINQQKELRKLGENNYKMAKTRGRLDLAAENNIYKIDVVSDLATWH